MKRLNFTFIFVIVFLCFATAMFTSCDEAIEEPEEKKEQKEPTPEVPEEPEAPKLPVTTVNEDIPVVENSDDGFTKTQKIVVTVTDGEGNEVKQEYVVETNSVWTFDSTPLNSNDFSPDMNTLRADETAVNIPVGDVIKSEEESVAVDSVKTRITTTYTIENTGFVLTHQKDILTLTINGKEQKFSGNDINVTRTVDVSTLIIEETPNQVDGEDYYLANQPITVDIKVGNETIQKSFNQSYNLVASVYDTEIVSKRNVIKSIEKDGNQYLGVIVYEQYFALSGKKVTIPEKLKLNPSANAGPDIGYMNPFAGWSSENDEPIGYATPTPKEYKQGEIFATQTHRKYMLCWVDFSFKPETEETTGKILINNEWVNYPYIEVEFGKVLRKITLIKADTYEGDYFGDDYRLDLTPEFKFVNSETGETLYTTTDELYILAFYTKEK